MGTTLDERDQADHGPAGRTTTADHRQGRRGGRTPWVRVAIAGQLVIAGAIAIATIGALVVGAFAMPIALVFPAVIAIGLLGAWLASRGTRTGLVTAMVLAVLVVGANLPFIVAGIATPASFWDFVPNLGALVGGILTVVGGAAALRGRGRGPVALAGTERRVLVGIAAFLGVAVAASAVLTGTSGTTVTAAQREGAVEVEAVDTAYTPELVSADAGGRIVVDNAGMYTHTFTVPELGIDVQVLPGSSALVDLPAQAAAGTWQFHCRPHSSGPDGSRTGMVGTLQVRS